jgi:uncharacterized membrane protein
VKKMVRCKACGFIIEEGKLGDKCPACGAPKTAFMPYVDTMSESRRKLLNFDLHPIAVHFPISFAVAVLVFSVAIVFLSGEALTLVTNTTKIMVLFIPVMIVIAGTVGFIDGKVRFRKIKNSKILQRKIFYAGIFFGISIILTVVVWTYGFTSTVSTLTAILLAAISVSLIVILSLFGTSITEAAFPGN